LAHERKSGNQGDNFNAKRNIAMGGGEESLPLRKGRRVFDQEKSILGFVYEIV